MSRSSAFVAVGLFVLLMLLVLLGALSPLGVSAPRAEAASAVKVSVRCDGNPEKTRVVNNTNRPIKVKKVGSRYQPRSNEPFLVNVKLRPGKAITFESGYDANQNVLTRQYIYNNDVGRKEGARVSTSVGRFVDRC